MERLFGKYTSTVRSLVGESYGLLVPFICDDNIEEIFDTHDNWNGGIDYYHITISLPVGVFTALKKDNSINTIEQTILSAYGDAMRGDDDSLVVSQVFIKADDSSKGKNIILDARGLWTEDAFRLFISHPSELKEKGVQLKNSLRRKGISCFVAHEDIKATQEWENQIKTALFSMDAMCAIVNDEFNHSVWCNQEVGVAVGLQKLVITINKGAEPNGFLSRFQAISSEDQTVGTITKNICDVIITHELTKQKYLDSLVSIIMHSRQEEEVAHLLEFLMTYDNVETEYISRLLRDAEKNPIFKRKKYSALLNALSEKYGIAHVQNLVGVDLDNMYPTDLPF